MERKEAVVYLYVGVLIIGALLAVYYFNLGLTGFAVFEQNTESSFNEGVYSDTLYDTNVDAVVLNLSSNATSGTYTSKTFDAGSSVTWNNLTWTGNEVTLEVRSCSTSDCANVSFTTVDLNNLNLTDQYFQYKASFDSANDTLTGVIVDYSSIPQPVPVSVSLSEPVGEKESNSGIPLTFTATGTNLTCSYNIVNSVTDENVLNSTIADCTSTTFSLGETSGDYILTIYVLGNEGNDSASTSFSLSVSDEEETTEEEEEVVEEVVPVEPIPQQTVSLTQISLGEISTLDVVQGETREMSLSVQNTGNTAVTGCSLSDDASGWITITSSSNNLGTGATAGLGFLVNIPEDIAPGVYTRELSVACAETSASKTFAINVAQKKLDFKITKVQRTSLSRVRVDYSLAELIGEDQDVQLFFSIKDASGVEVANVTQNSSIDANETNNFRANIPINSSLEGNLTLSASLNLQQYSVSVNEPITLGAPTGFFVLGDDLGTTGNVLAIIVLVIIGAAVYFFVIRRKKAS